jgi:hypothetical protein
MSLGSRESSQMHHLGNSAQCSPQEGDTRL